MTQSNPTLGLGLPVVARRMPAGGYRIVAPSTANPNSERICAMWVPADAFRRGTQIIVEANVSGAAGVVVQLGGDNSAGLLGVSLAITSNAAAVCALKYTWTQKSDGVIVDFDSSGGSFGSTSTGTTTAATTAFIQPLTLVELRNGASVTVTGASLTVLPPATPYLTSAAVFNK